jgi:hypothetical protein
MDPRNTTPDTAAEAGRAAQICYAWWMFDNHTFRKIKLDSQWWVKALECFDSDPHGCFFVRNAAEKEIFSAHGHGHSKRVDFIAEILKFDPHNATAQASADTNQPKRNEPR